MNKFILFLSSLFLCGSLGVQAEDPHQHNHPIDPNEYSVFAEPLAGEVENPVRQQQLQNSDRWQRFEARHGSWFVNFNTLTGLPMRGAGKGIEVQGSNEIQQAQYFLQRELAEYALPIAELRFHQINKTAKYSYVEFKQFYEGMELLNSKASVRIDVTGKVVAFTLDVFKGIEVDAKPFLSQSNLKAEALKHIEGEVEEVIFQSERKVLPIPLLEDSYVFKQVQEMEIIGEGRDHAPFRYYALVDAQTGETYYRSNRIATYRPTDHPTLLGPVTDNSNWEVEQRSLANMRVVIGEEEYITNSAGQIPITADTRLEGVAYMEGPYCRVLIGEEGEEVPSYPIFVPLNSSEVHLPDSVKLWESSVFYHTNRVHDFMKIWMPEDFTLLDYSMPTRVQRTDGDCNAFYNWNGINFYTEGGGCFTLAEFADVVFHEYGHAINHRVYEYYGNSMSNSSINEGYADVWALGLTKNPILAGGYRTSNPSSFIRRYDGFKKRFPENWVNGLQHNNGEIIAGSWIDLQAAIGFDTAFELFIETQSAAPMRPNGLEGRLYADVLFEALVADDDDGDLSNGTPHSEQIFKAFGDHGIFLQVDADIRFEEVPIVEEGQVIEVPIVLDIDFNYLPYLERISLKYKDQRSDNYKRIDVISLTGDNNYTAYMLSFDKGTVVNFYFELEDNGGASLPTVTFPFGVTNEELPNHPYQLLVGYHLIESDDFSASSDLWTLGAANDDAESGFWEIGSPTRTDLRGGEIVQSGEDYSPSEDNICAVTGLNTDVQEYSLEETGVWGGQTSLISPVYDLTDFEEPAISYYRWFTNHQGVNPNTESWRVYITNDGGESWVEVENTLTGDRSWRFVALRVRDYVEPTANVQLRFVAEDQKPEVAPVGGGGEPFDGVSLVEAMVDDVNLYDTGLQTDIDDFEGKNQVWLTFPNPVRETLQVHYLGNQMGAAKQLQLYSITGQLVVEETIDEAVEGVDLSALSKGVYWLQIVEGEVLHREKLVVY